MAVPEPISVRTLKVLYAAEEPLRRFGSLGRGAVTEDWTLLLHPLDRDEIAAADSSNLAQVPLIDAENQTCCGYRLLIRPEVRPGFALLSYHIGAAEEIRVEIPLWLRCKVCRQRLPNPKEWLPFGFEITCGGCLPARFGGHPHG